MTLPKYQELALLINLEDIEKEILSLQKSLFENRVNRSSNKDIKFHTIKHAKRRIAQLKFKKSILIKLT
jgi:ribosomal protein L29